MDPPHHTRRMTIKIQIHSSCEIEDSVETDICKQFVILRSRVLRVVLVSLCAYYALLWTPKFSAYPSNFWVVWVRRPYHTNERRVTDHRLFSELLCSHEPITHSDFVHSLIALSHRYLPWQASSGRKL